MDSNNVLCYHGRSNLLVKNKQTDVFEITKVKHLYSNIHQVFDTKTKTFVDVKLNVITGKVSELYMIPKDSLGIDVPNINFYVTGGHKLLINNQKVRVRNIPQAIKVTISPDYVYSICTDEECPILINNINVFTWSYSDVLKYSDSRNIKWKNNSKFQDES